MCKGISQLHAGGHTVGMCRESVTTGPGAANGALITLKCLQGALCVAALSEDTEATASSLASRQQAQEKRSLHKKQSHLNPCHIHICRNACRPLHGAAGMPAGACCTRTACCATTRPAAAERPSCSPHWQQWTLAAGQAGSSGATAAGRINTFQSAACQAAAGCQARRQQTCSSQTPQALC
jgi:hypothetical protein